MATNPGRRPKLVALSGERKGVVKRVSRAALSEDRLKLNAEQVKRAEDRRTCLQMSLEGKNHREISLATGFKLDMVDRLLKEAREETKLSTEQIRDQKVLELLELARCWMPKALGLSTELFVDKDGVLFRQAINFGAQRDAVGVWTKVLAELRYWTAADKLDPIKAPDPSDMGMTDVDRELEQIAALLKANQQGPAQGHPG